MRAGQVVSIRVNPRDCMSVLDVMEKAGIPTGGKSFSSIVSLALSSMLEGLRRSGTITDRDGSEFLEMVGPFLKTSHKQKLQSADYIHKLGSEFQVAPIMPTERREAVASTPTQEVVTTEQLRARRFLAELCAKKRLAVQPGSGVLFQRDDEEEFARLYQAVYYEPFNGDWSQVL